MWQKYTGFFPAFLTADARLHNKSANMSLIVSTLMCKLGFILI